MGAGFGLKLTRFLLKDETGKECTSGPWGSRQAAPSMPLSRHTCLIRRIKVEGGVPKVWKSQSKKDYIERGLLARSRTA